MYVFFCFLNGNFLTSTIIFLIFIRGVHMREKGEKERKNKKRKRWGVHERERERERERVVVILSLINIWKLKTDRRSSLNLVFKHSKMRNIIQTLLNEISYQTLFYFLAYSFQCLNTENC